MKTTPDQWGPDHWNLLLYCETRAVDRGGVLDLQHLCCDPQYKTRLRDGEIEEDHTDMDCLDDLETHGYLENTGTGVNPVVRLTDKGWQTAWRLRRMRAEKTPLREFLP